MNSGMTAAPAGGPLQPGGGAASEDLGMLPPDHWCRNRELLTVGLMARKLGVTNTVMTSGPFCPQGGRLALVAPGSQPVTCHLGESGHETPRLRPITVAPWRHSQLP